MLQMKPTMMPSFVIIFCHILADLCALVNKTSGANASAIDLKYYPVKNYRRGIADFICVILLKRRRIAGEVSTLWA